MCVNAQNGVMGEMIIAATIVRAQRRCEEGCDEDYGVLCAVGFIIDGRPRRNPGRAERLRAAATSKNAGIAIQRGEPARAGNA